MNWKNGRKGGVRVITKKIIDKITYNHKIHKQKLLKIEASVHYNSTTMNWATIKGCPYEASAQQLDIIYVAPRIETQQKDNPVLTKTLCIKISKLWTEPQRKVAPTKLPLNN